MSKETGFTHLAKEKKQGDLPEIGVGMLGYAFMGKAHSHAFKSLPYMIETPPARPRLVGICGRNKSAVTSAAARYGYEYAYTDWRDMIDNKDIQLISNGGPNFMHAEPSIVAAQAGKHILCEKPLGRTAEESKDMLDAVENAGVKHMAGFNYRFVPALVHARNLIKSGALGRIYHFRAVYLQEWLLPAYNTPRLWRMNKEQAGSGVLGDLGTHIIDLSRFLLGEMVSVQAKTKTFIPERELPDGSGTGPVDVDDAFAALVEFDNGALGTLEASRFATGRKNHQRLEINGENGSLMFNLERLNELNVYWHDDETSETQGFHNVLVSESYHPWLKNWWPHGHMLGWEHTLVHELTHFLDCIVNDKNVSPDAATFYDGYKAAVISDAILESADLKKQIDIKD
ncbi:MAG: Gfo/Idh/MocA family oxidoreductase [candidate division KSB1 bacterium]|nr:Gfo/Idh/MocA family oxidoreductase [candidate division KSB1 bacterium]